MKRLTNRVAIITGASKGIGAGIAKSLAAEGASVVINYASSKEGAEKVAAEIITVGGQATTIKGDVSKEEDIDRIIQETLAVYGALDILVNNAGIYQFNPLEEVNEADFHRQFNTNVLGLLLMTQKAVKHFSEKGGSIINISSSVTRIATPGSSIYTATKASVDGITRVLSKELGPKKIRINSINPGLIETEGTYTAGVIGSDFHTYAESQTPLGRIGTPNDIGRIAVFLASDESAWLTGEILMADGGMH